MNLKIGYAMVKNSNTVAIKIKKIIKNNKLGLVVGSITLLLFSIYIILLYNFINLLKIYAM